MLCTLVFDRSHTTMFIEPLLFGSSARDERRHQPQSHSRGHDPERAPQMLQKHAAIIGPAEAETQPAI
jgi:hypothetical protein